MQRRVLLRAGCAFAFTGAWTSNLAQAHTPFNQWVVYRQKHLLIGCHKQDAATYPLAQKLVETLQEKLPEAKARVARAPDARRLASLLGTEQFDFALLGYEDAKLMSAGEGNFKPYGKIELNALFLLPRHVLAGRTDIPARHAWLIAHALHGSTSDDMTNADQTPPLPWHTGTKLFFDGKPAPNV